MRRILPILLLALLIIVPGCGLFDMPDNEMPDTARLELTGETDARVQVVYANDFTVVGDLLVPVDPDTIESALPMSRQYDIEKPEFHLIIHRLNPGEDNLGVKVWAGDFLFVDEPVLPDSQETMRVRYRYSDFGR